MHKHHESGESVAAPEPVQKAKNLVEEFFGLTLADAEFYPHELFSSGRYSQYQEDHYHCQLLSPTGRALTAYSFVHRRDNGWVKISCSKGSNWQEALQTAIDNFVNNPKGGNGVLGDFRPTAEKLNAGR